MATAPRRSAWGFTDDVLMEILIKLPSRSLLLLKSVSKHWFALIQSPYFINMHLNRPSNNRILVVNQRKSNLVTFLLSDNDDKTLAYKYNMSLESLSYRICHRGLLHKRRLLGPCNGLICITDTVDIVLFNPATKQRREVIRLRSVYRALTTWSHHKIFVPCFDRVCFGYDSVSLDYKVVGFRVISEQHISDKGVSGIGSSYNSDRKYYSVEIYSLSTKTWSHVVAPASSMPWLRDKDCDRDFFFNGAFHWLGSCSNDICSVVVFDINKEAFKEFKLPCNFPLYGGYQQLYLSALDDEYLTMFKHGLFRPNNETEIWVMKEYGVYSSWTKLYSISLCTVISYPLSFSKDGGEFFFRDSNGQLVSFNLKTQEIKKLEVANCEGVPVLASRYRESLVPL